LTEIRQAVAPLSISKVNKFYYFFNFGVEFICVLTDTNFVQ
jgi:hypothetical protein